MANVVNVLGAAVLVTEDNSCLTISKRRKMAFGEHHKHLVRLLVDLDDAAQSLGRDARTSRTASNTATTSGTSRIS